MSEDFRKKFPVDKTGNCQIDDLDRQMIIDRYCRDGLPQADMDAFDEHLLYCRSCPDTVQLLSDLKPAFESLDKIPAGRFQKGYRLIRQLAAACLILLCAYGLLWGAGRSMQPATHSLAAVSHLDLNESRRGDAGNDDFRQGTEALSSAPYSWLGLFAGYDSQKAARAAEYLTRAYGPIDKDINDKKSRTAFLIAKAYLMQGATAPAKTWLQRSIDHYPNNRDRAEIDTILKKLAEL